jgi:hypothetical protein
MITAVALGGVLGALLGPGLLGRDPVPGLALAGQWQPPLAAPPGTLRCGGGEQAGHLWARRELPAARLQQPRWLVVVAPILSHWGALHGVRECGGGGRKDSDSVEGSRREKTNSTLFRLFP